MVEAKEGNVDINFFKNIIQKEEKNETSYEDCLESKVTIKYISGWIIRFFGYIKYNYGFSRFYGDKINGDDLNNFPSQILNVPFLIKQENKRMKFEAGFFGCEQNDKKEVSPFIGWMVSPISSGEKGQKDEQFESIPLSDDEDSEDDSYSDRE